jgi:hypothetical protein
MDDNFTNIIDAAKPYRNIIKRYWTEEEVPSIFITYFHNLFLKYRTRNWESWLINMGYIYKFKAPKNIYNFYLYRPKTGSESPLSLTTEQMSSVSIDGKKYSTQPWSKVPGLMKKTLNWSKWSQNMGHRTGHKLQLHCLAELASNAEKDGTTTSTLTSKRTNGLNRKIIW